MKPLIIVGCAECVFDDIKALPVGDFDYMAINYATGFVKNHIVYAATYHPFDCDILEQMKYRRILIKGNTDYKVIAHKAGHGVDIVEPFVAPSGSSAMLGVLAAIRLGYEKIVLCGCPLIGSRDLLGDVFEFKLFQQGWIAKAGTVRDKVKSMSGWTKDFLGSPTSEWLGIKDGIV